MCLVWTHIHVQPLELRGGASGKKSITHITRLANLTDESEGLSLATTVMDLLSKPVARGGTGGVTELDVVPRDEGP